MQISNTRSGLYTRFFLNILKMNPIKYLKYRISCLLIMAIPLLIVTSCTSESPTWLENNREASFLVFRRQSQIGEETFKIYYSNDTITVKSSQGENERGRITGVVAELRMNKDLTPVYYSSEYISGDTTNVLKMQTATTGNVSVWEDDFEVVTTKTPPFYFPVHSTIPAAMEMMLYQYMLAKGISSLPTFPRGGISISHTATDTVTIKGERLPLDRYVVEGINWGGRTIWLDANKNLIALVKANTQIREMIRKGYEEAMPVFIAGNVMEQMKTLEKYSENLKGEQAEITALVGGDIWDGLSSSIQKDMTLIVEAGRIKEIGTRANVSIPNGARIIELKGKTLIPGLWDMHAHSNQVQWAPAYLAGGITTIRDNGNELELATAFRDAIAEKGAIGPDILLAGMTDGPGIKGNGVIRATSAEQAREVVAMYHKNGYKQIKIYNSIAPDILKVLTEEAHKIGMSVTGHVPNEVGNAVDAVESGMDQLSHRARFLTALFPDKNLADLKGNYLADNEITPEQIEKTADFFLKHQTVLDPTIALDVIRALPSGIPVETVEPDVGRIAYELFEDKRFRKGLSEERSQMAVKDYTKAMEIIGVLHKAGVPVVAGTDNVVPVFSLYLELETYHQLGGLTTAEALKTATVIPAKVMGMEKETGTLEAGKQADITILDQNPLENIANIRTVSAVMTNGNYYTSAPLWKAADFLPKRPN